jgi:hypothetical protein
LPRETSPRYGRQDRDRPGDWRSIPSSHIPALDGKTPREAVRTGVGRHRVDVLLRDIEHRESRLPPAQRVDLAPLRRDLGLDS